MLSRLYKRGYAVEEEPANERTGIDPDFDSDFDPEESDSQSPPRMELCTRRVQSDAGMIGTPDGSAASITFPRTGQSPRDPDTGGWIRTRTPGGFDGMCHPCGYASRLHQAA